MSFEDESDHRLMAGIYGCWGRLVSDACRYSSVPPDFLAALIANESEGDPGLTRFHPRIYQCLSAVRNGTREHYRTVSQKDLRSVSDGLILKCAASWGLTQVMGYEVLCNGDSPRRLLEPEFNLRRTLQLLAVFAESSGADLRKDFEDLFRCWKTGRNDGATRDPEYIAKGMARMGLCCQLTGPVVAQAA